MTASSTTLGAGMDHAGWHAVDLWRAAIAIGGDFSRGDVDALLDGTRLATGAEHDILASTLNDHFVGHDEDHPILYWRDLDH
jgi:hypothetical protein